MNWYLLLLLLTALTCNAQVPYRGFAQGIPGEAWYYDSFPVKSGLTGAWIVDGYTYTNYADEITGSGNMLTNKSTLVGLTNFNGNTTYRYTGALTSYSYSINTNGLFNTNATLSMWIYPPNYGSSIAMLGGVIDSGAWTTGYWFQQYNGGGTDTIFAVNSYSAHLTRFQIPTNSWTHLCGTYDGKTVIVYTNGVLAASTAYTNSIIVSASSRMFVGGYSNADAYQKNCYADTVSVFNRALTPAEVAQLYTTGKSGGRHP